MIDTTGIEAIERNLDRLFFWIFFNASSENLDLDFAVKKGFLAMVNGKGAIAQKTAAAQVPTQTAPASTIRTDMTLKSD